VTWTWYDGSIVVLGAFAIYIVGSVMIAVVAIPMEGRTPGFWLIPVSYLALTFGTFFMVQVWLILHRGGTWRMVGFRVPRAKSVWVGISWMAGLAACAYVLTLVGSAIIVGLFDLTPFHIKSNVKELLPKHQQTVSATQFVVLIILVSVVAPLTEETLFRGALYQGLARDIGHWLGKPAGIGISVVLTGITFGLFHLLGGAGELYTLPLLAFLGMVLCLTFQFSGSLGGSMMLHGTVNLISVVVFYGAHLR